MKKKFNPELLKEELKKFKLLSEYSFYTGENTTYGYDKDKAVILGDTSLKEEDENPEDAAADIADDLGLDPEEVTNTDEKPVQEPGNEENPKEEPESGDDLSFGDSEGDTEGAPVEGAGNDVEIDVTSLVKGTEDAKIAADKATQNTEALLQKLSDLESKIASMDAIGDKITELEKELVKRNPTPVEKLEMRSLSSFPYSQKLTDYWAEKGGAYDVMGNEEKKDEYVLTKDEVDRTYSEPEIKKSFNVNPEDFEEEEI